MFSANQSNNNPAEIFRSNDLYLCAYLCARGVPLTRTEKDRDRVFFIFRDKDQAQKFVAEYLNNGPIPVLDFKSYVRELKSLIFRAKENKND